jgi:hypothetical protein
MKKLAAEIGQEVPWLAQDVKHINAYGMLRQVTVAPLQLSSDATLYLIDQYETTLLCHQAHLPSFHNKKSSSWID